MSETIQFKEAMLDEQAYLVPDFANLTISVKTANQIPLDIKNKQRLVIVVNSSLSPDAISLVEKMIIAVKLDPAIVPVLVMEKPGQFTLQQIKKQLQPECLLALGPDGASLRYYGDYVLYDAVKQNSTTMIFCDAADAMEKNKKAALWNCLKTVFGI